MKIFAIFEAVALLSVSALNVVQVMDSVILEKDQYIMLQNFNEANSVSQEEKAFNQSLTVKVTNKFENYKFDVLIFDVDDETGESPDLVCYLQAIQKGEYDTDCKFGEGKLKSEMLLNQDSYSINLKTKNESNDKDRIIIIDNTPFPPQGSQNNDDFIVLEYVNQSSYTMQYNLRNTSIVLGLVCMILAFTAGALLYLTLKVKRDIKRKFLTDEEEEEDLQESDGQDDRDQIPQNVALN